jgi:predicted TIM-barrel fold metal-dependent hydrolase
LQGLAHIPEWKISSNTKLSINILNDAIENLHLSGLQFLPDQLDFHNKQEHWDDIIFDPFWSAFADLNVPLFITPRYTSLTSNSDLVESLNNELLRIKKWMDRFPQVKVIWTHGLAWRLFITEKDLSIPASVFQSAPIDNHNFYLQLMFPISLGDIWEYPMKQTLPVLKEITRNFGADRLIWGTDMPIVLRHFTYKQCLDQIKIHGKEVLTNEEIKMISGGTMQKLMNLKK